MKKLIRSVLLFFLFTLSLHAQWVNAGLDSFAISALTVDGNNIVAGTKTQGVYLSTNEGANWSTINNGFPVVNILPGQWAEVNCLSALGTTLFAATNAGLVKSTNNGAQWTKADSGIMTSHINFLAWRYLNISHVNLYAGTDAGIFLSTNNGTSWTVANTGLTNLNIHSLTGLNQYEFVGTNAGVFLSTNEGASWKSVNTGLPNATINSLVTLGTNFFAGTLQAGETHPYGDVFLSTDTGATWTATHLPGDAPITAIITLGNNIIAASGGAFVGASEGIFLSSNNGTSWTKIDTALTLYMTALAYSNKYLFAANYSGVRRRLLSEIITEVKDKPEQTPSQFELQQNYPNPFNPSTIINYQLAMKSHVTLKIYDILGREVAALVNEEKPAGSYNMQWNAEGFASGMYFCRIQTRDYTSTIKLLLQK